jgi:hypothetical protein
MPDRKFFSELLMVLGGLWAALSGLCTVAGAGVGHSIACEGNPRCETPDVILHAWAGAASIGAPSIGIGLVFFFIGWRLRPER